jgi:hypothetical protein
MRSCKIIRHKSTLRYFLLSLLLTALPAVLHAQGSTSGTVTGTITDPSGAPVSGAAVTIRNLGTNAVRSMKSAGGGVYAFSNLEPALYDLQVEMPGFQTTTIREIKLDVNASRRVDVPLTVGQVTEKINVEATPPLLNTENASVSQVIETKRVNELPLNGRDFQQLQLLTPGSVAGVNYQTSQGMAGGASSLTTNGTMNIANGGRPGQVLFTVDGAANSNQNGRGIIQRPSIDEISEFRVQTSNMSAEFGYGSSVVNVSIKSGTNELHGSLYEFLRNDAMDARSFFAQSVEPLKRNQFGGTAGGPVIIPKLYNGKDKTFWFFSYEGLRLHQATNQIASVPTTQMRTGDLSQLSAAIYDPVSTRPDPAKPGAYLRTPFPNNLIPTNRIDPVAKFFLDPSWIPLPNVGGVSNNLAQEISVPTDYNQFTTKIDQHFGSSNILMGRYSQTREADGSVGPYHGFNQYDPGANPKTPTSYNSVLDWTHIFGPRDLLDARFTFSRAHTLFSTPNYGNTDYTTQLGIQGFGPGVSDIYPSYPQVSISGYTGLPQGFLLNYISNDFEYSANYTMVRGRHTFKMGETFREWQQNLTTSGQGSGSFSFTGAYTNNPQNPSQSGLALADFMLGTPASGSRYIPPGWFYQRIRSQWAYFNDDWKVTSKLTVNLGVRYEINWPTTEKNGQFATFDTSARNGRGAIVVPDQKSVSPPYLQRSVPLSWPVYSQVAVFADQVGLSPKYLRNVGYSHFAPRAGIAYQLDSKTVIRTGYGLFYVPLDGNRESEFESAPFLVRESGILNDPLLPTHTTQTLFPLGSSFSQFASIFGHDPNAANFGYSQQWNISVQRQLPGAFSFDIAYVGTKGTKLQTSRAINAPLPGPGAVQARRPFPDFGVIAWNEQSANSTYNSLQAKLERRFYKGLSLLTSFTWSRNIDDDSDDSEGYYDPYNTRFNRGPSSFDIPLNFTAGVVYELPWLQHSSGLTRALAGGWTLGSIISLHDGLPYTPAYSGDPSNTGTSSRADVVPGCDATLSSPTPQRWFNTNCFVAPPGPPVYRRGNAGRNILRGDAYKNFDISLFKNFAFTETRRIQLRFEGFNVFNQHSFGFPNATVNSPSYGTVTTSSPGRILQVAAKFYF